MAVTRKLIKSNSDKAYVYIRVSTKKQSNTMAGHTSLEIQKEECVKKAKEMGFKDNNITVFEDVMSAKNLDKQKGFNKMMRLLENGDTVLFYSTSRMSRNVRQALTALYKIEDRGADYYFVQENLSSKGNASQKLTLHNMLASAQYERELLGERIKASVEKRRKMGSHMGKAPYGYQHKRLEDGKLILVEVPSEQNVLTLIKNLANNRGDAFSTKDLRDALSNDEDEMTDDSDSDNNNSDDHVSYSEISKKLNEDGYKRRNNKPWTASAVRYFYLKSS